MVAKVKGIKSLIDRGHYLDKNVKIMSKELDGIKVKIRQHAKATQKGQHAGVKSKVLVSPSSTSYIDPMKVWVALGRNIRTFKHVVKIIKGQLNGFVSEDDVTKMSSIDTDPFKTVRFFDSGDVISDNGRLIRKLDSA